MSERLRHPNIIKRILHLEEKPTEGRLKEINEYRVLKKELQLSQPLRIFYPACGQDITLSRVFRRSHIYYVDNDPEAYNALVNAKLPKRKTTITEGSAIESSNQPSDVDMVVLRNQTIHEEDFDKTVASLVDPLKKGGYALTHAWGNSGTASELQMRDDMELVGYFSEDVLEPRFIQDNLDQVADTLEEHRGNVTSRAYSGVTFVFQKK